MESENRKRGGGYVHPELRIVPDSFNNWSNIGSIILSWESPVAKKRFNEVLQKDMRTYEQYIHDQYQPGEAEELIKNTAPEKIIEFDQLTAEFNADRERILKEADVQSLKKLYDRASALTRGK